MENLGMWQAMKNGFNKNMIDPVINDLNRYLQRIDNQDAKDEEIAARVKELLSEDGDFYPWSIDNMLEALASIDPDSDTAENMAIGGETNNGLRFYEAAQQEIHRYWIDRATEMATASFPAEAEVNKFQAYLKALTGK